MKQNVIITFGLFIFSQFMFWVISQADNVANTEEILGIATFIGLFLALYFAGFRWVRWIVTVMLGALIYGLIVIKSEGLGISFLGVASLCAAVIVMIFKYPPAAKATPAEHTIDDSEILDAHEIVTLEKSSPDSFSAENGIYRYPLLVKRYQSMFIDSMLLLFTMVTTMVILDESPYRQTVMITIAAIFILGYEPILTAYSATIGQRIMGIRVRLMDDPGERINLVQAYIRVIVKWVLGWMSFVTINFNPEHRAIHDMAGNSVVILVQ